MTIRRPGLGRALATLLLLFQLTLAVSPVSAVDAGSQPVFFAVRVNGEDHGTVRLVQAVDGRLFARQADLAQWRLRPPPSATVKALGEDHVPLDAFSGTELRIDSAQQSIEIQVPARFFELTRLNPSGPQAQAPQPVSAGGFLGYDVSFDETAGARSVGGLFEVGAFGSMGVFTTSLLMQGRRATRLDSTLTRDFPESMETLRLGDTFGASGLWGRSVRFGGLRFGTNFATAPTLSTLPMPGLSGEAVLPSATDLYIDGVLRQTVNVPAGPFRIDGLPVLSGQGEVRLVVRDLLGREQVITLPYYASTSLLRAGLVDHSFEIGRIRNGYGSRADHYGRLAAVYQHRRGLSDRLTGEMRLEWLEDQYAAGIGGSGVLGELGVVSAAGAFSSGPNGSGRLMQAAFERIAMRGPSFALRGQWTTPAFNQLGQPPGEPAVARRLSASAGVPTGWGGSVSGGFVSTVARDRAPVEVATLGYTQTLGRSAALVLNGARSFSGDGATTVSLTLVIGLGNGMSAAGSVMRQDGGTVSQLQVQRNLQSGDDTGFRALVGDGPTGQRAEAGVIRQSSIGSFIAEAANLSGTTSVRAGVTGGLTLLAGRPFLSRRLGEGFGVVHVPDFPGVAVYVNNRLAARTDPQGYAILTDLLPYQANPVRIETSDLPIDTAIDTTQLQAVPHFRSGVMLRFPVRRSASALVRLVLEDGEPIPLGAEVMLEGGAEPFIVANDGEVYLTGLSTQNRLSATWNGQRCTFDVDPGDRLGQLPRIGPVLCAGVRR